MTENKKTFFQKNKGVMILLGIVLVSLFFCSALPLSLQWISGDLFGVPGAVRPVITLPGEALNPEAPMFTLFGQEVFLTNTLIATWVSYALLLIAALIGRAQLKEVPSGFGNVVETIIEMLYNISEQTIGHKHARSIFPIAATIFLVIMVANLSKMVPGFESVGILHHAHEGAEGFGAEEIGNSNIYYLVQEDHADEIDEADHSEEDAEHADEDPAEEAEHAEEGGHGDYVVTPFLRGAATDINFPLGLSIISFLTIQYFGFKSLRLHYVGKFINVGALERGGMGFMDFGVGLLELILEPIKMVSLTFRLLGNIFGGAVLVIVVSSLVPYLLPTGLYVYEIFVGVIQAYVFFMLTLVFSAMAMIGHGDDHDEHAEAH